MVGATTVKTLLVTGDYQLSIGGSWWAIITKCALCRWRVDLYRDGQYQYGREWHSETAARIYADRQLRLNEE